MKKKEELFSVRLKDRRVSLNLTQVELAEALKVNQEEISYWENGKRVPSRFTQIGIMSQMDQIKPKK